MNESKCTIVIECYGNITFGLINAIVIINMIYWVPYKIIERQLGMGASSASPRRTI